MVTATSSQILTVIAWFSLVGQEHGLCGTWQHQNRHCQPQYTTSVWSLRYTTAHHKSAIEVVNPCWLRVRALCLLHLHSGIMPTALTQWYYAYCTYTVVLCLLHLHSGIMSTALTQWWDSPGHDLVPYNSEAGILEWGSIPVVIEVHSKCIVSFSEYNIIGRVRGHGSVLHGHIEPDYVG